MGHVLIENRGGLAVEATLSHATGTAEREATLVMLGRRTARSRITLGADKADDAKDGNDANAANDAENASRRCSAGSGPKPDKSASKSEAKPKSPPPSPSPPTT